VWEKHSDLGMQADKELYVFFIPSLLITSYSTPDKFSDAMYFIIWNILDFVQGREVLVSSRRRIKAVFPNSHTGIHLFCFFLDRSTEILSTK